MENILKLQEDWLTDDGSQEMIPVPQKRPLQSEHLSAYKSASGWKRGEIAGPTGAQFISKRMAQNIALKIAPKIAPNSPCKSNIHKYVGIFLT